MTSSTEPQQFSFQAEISQLLQLLSHSLYQNREIAIRELISNASDALDKLRYLSLKEKIEIKKSELQIKIEPNEEEKTLSIIDNGIGMTRDELIKNLGTIAHSGSLNYLKELSEADKPDVSLIGQFGVGFYASFMLAEKVEVFSLSVNEDSTENSTGWRWESDGTGNFTVEEAENLTRGTRIVLHLRDDLTEFTTVERLKFILKKYSTFVPYPIYLQEEHVNDQPPIWVEPKQTLKEEQYEQFYQYLSHHSDEKPLWHLHLSSDSPFQFHSILYCPPTNLEQLGFGHFEHGINLCAKRVLVENDCKELLPEYLRFLYGLVDSADLPLNISRESLQDNTVFRKMRKVIVKQVLNMLTKMADKEQEKYAEFYKNFGSILREGTNTDFDNRETIAKLLRFQTSQADINLTSLDAYIERAGEDQTQIYFVGGADVDSINRNPQLEVFKKKNLEVLYLPDPVDEFLLTQMHQYEEKQLVAIDSAEILFPGETSESTDDTEDETKPEGKTAEDYPKGFETVLQLFKEELADDVQDVSPSERLTESPCCLVNPKGAFSTQLQKVISMQDKNFEMGNRIFEINPQAAIIKRLAEISANEENASFIKQTGRQLFDNAMLQAGLVPDIHSMVSRIDQYLTELAAGKLSN